MRYFQKYSEKQPQIRYYFDWELRSVRTFETKILLVETFKNKLIYIGTENGELIKIIQEVVDLKIKFFLVLISAVKSERAFQRLKNYDQAKCHYKSLQRNIKQT